MTTAHGTPAQQAWDELSIKRTLARLSRAQDDVDRESYKTCFTDRVLLRESVVIPNWQAREIPVDELADLYFAEMDKLVFGHHLVTNHVIEVSGDEATCLADLWCVSAERDGDALRSTSLGARYDLKLRRQGDEWRICERSIHELYAIATGDVIRQSFTAPHLSS